MTFARKKICFPILWEGWQPCNSHFKRHLLHRLLHLCSKCLLKGELFTDQSAKRYVLKGTGSHSLPADCRGVFSYPPTTMALFPPFSRLPPPPLMPTPLPAHNFWTLYMQFCAILCMLSVNFGSCQSGIITKKQKKI